MRTDLNPTIYRHDYQPYPYRLADTHLLFDLDATLTRTQAILQFEHDLPGAPAPLVLQGDRSTLSLESIVLDGQALTPDAYQLTDDTLTVYPTTPNFTLHLTCTSRPDANTALMGLYASGDSLFTQCEAEGFRRITWFPDRPDVMSRYTVTLRAHPHAYPTLLSNGNLIHTATLPDGRHEAVWQDPFLKPSYLFALVAGQFDCREDTVQTRSGRNVLLQIYSDPGTHDKTAWALRCLKKSLAWDESRFGLELDLDRFMVVATRDFNMGAMENKGLNIFNSTYVLADPDSATDTGYEAIESIIGHEYFHNWTGNRITCRDWFQLSLKEGLTVFRDQEFSADMMAASLDAQQAASARAVKRIDDVSVLRVAQFPEDAGPMAHPIRPESYQEIANFYTATIYEKGAEVIRMLHTLLGEDVFQAGIREYIKRHDGQAVTCDDFVDAMQAAWQAHDPDRSLDVFRRWYAQAGTPTVKVDMQYDAAQRSCTLTLSQTNPPAGIERQQTDLHKAPLHIPLALGMLDTHGQTIALHVQGGRHPAGADTVLLELDQASQQWTFTQVPTRPVLSLLRGFSAPVQLAYPQTDAELALLARHDPDPFTRWEAGQTLATRCLHQPSSAAQTHCTDTWRHLLTDTQLSPAYRTRALSLPAEKVVMADMTPMHPQAVAQARRQLQQHLGQALADDWLAAYQTHHQATPGTYQPDAASAGHRALKNLALSYLAIAQHPQAQGLALTQYRQAHNLTDRLGGLSALLQLQDPDAGHTALADFYERWHADPIIIDRWFALQASAPTTTVADIRRLMQHPAFTLRNPNRARAVVFQFCNNNLLNVHQPDGYAFWAEHVIALDALNPEIAARLARAFDNWAQYAPDLRNAVQHTLEQLRQHPSLSKNVAEIINKALQV